MESMMTPTHAPPRLGNLLIRRGYVTVEQLEEALAYQKAKGRGKLLGEILVDLDFCSEDQVIECLACEYGVPHARLEARLYDPKAVDLLPREYIEKHGVFPLFKIRGVLSVAISELSNLFLVEEIKNLTRLDVQIVAASTKRHPPHDLEPA